MANRFALGGGTRNKTFVEGSSHTEASDLDARMLRAATRALASGTTLQKVIDLVARVAPTIKAPLVLFTYYNPIYQRGFDVFVNALADAGVRPDVESNEVREAAANTEACVQAVAGSLDKKKAYARVCGW